LNVIAAKKSRCRSNFLSEHALFGSCAAQSFPVRSQRQEIRRNKQQGHGLSSRPAILSPLPPCLVGQCGRSRRTDRLRPNLFGGDLVCCGAFWWNVVPRCASARASCGKTRYDPNCTITTAMINVADTPKGAAIRRDAEMTIRENYAVACRSRGRALRPKNSAWLATAETTASWNGLAIRNAGSGRCPVRKRSG
jgi:hypothetical protein